MTSQHAFLVALFDRHDQAEDAVRRLAERDVPLDQISLLARSGGSGDDVIGIVHPDVGERMQVWGKQGALWGGLLGALAGAAGLVFLPEIGPVLVLGPLAQMIGGGVLSAGLVGAGSAVAAGLSQIGVLLQQHGLPAEELERLHQAIEQGDTVVLIPGDLAEQTEADDVLRRLAPKRLEWLGSRAEV